MKNISTSNAVQDNTNLNMNKFGVQVGEIREHNFDVAVIQPQSSIANSQELVVFKLTVVNHWLIILLSVCQSICQSCKILINCKLKIFTPYT